MHSSPLQHHRRVLIEAWRWGWVEGRVEWFLSRVCHIIGCHSVVVIYYYCMIRWVRWLLHKRYDHVNAVIYRNMCHNMDFRRGLLRSSHRSRCDVENGMTTMTVPEIRIQIIHVWEYVSLRIKQYQRLAQHLFIAISKRKLIHDLEGGSILKDF